MHLDFALANVDLQRDRGDQERRGRVVLELDDLGDRIAHWGRKRRPAANARVSEAIGMRRYYSRAKRRALERGWAFRRPCAGTAPERPGPLACPSRGSLRAASRSPGPPRARRAC